MMICIGGVCVPLNLLIPFLVGVLHRYGYFKWFKEDWVTITYWKRRYARWTNSTAGNASGSGAYAAKTADREAQADKRRVNDAVDAAMQQSEQTNKEGESVRKRRTGSSRDTGG